MVPKSDGWSTMVVLESDGWSTMAVPESDGWSTMVVPESDGCQQTRVGVLEGYRKARGAGRVPESVARGKGWLARIGKPEYLREDVAGQIRGYKKQTVP